MREFVREDYPQGEEPLWRASALFRPSPDKRNRPPMNPLESFPHLPTNPRNCRHLGCSSAPIPRLVFLLSAALEQKSP